MPRGKFENRYLRFYKGGVQVRIVRLAINYSRKFNFRSHGGRDLSVMKARRHRDRAYLEIFGSALTESSHLLKPRGNSILPVGVSAVKDSDNEIIAYISSWQDKDGGTVRCYTAVQDGNHDLALNKAIEKRIDGLIQSDRIEI